MLKYFLDTEHTKYKEKNTRAKSIMQVNTKNFIIVTFKATS